MDDEEGDLIFRPPESRQRYNPVANDNSRRLRVTDDYHLRQEHRQRRLLLIVRPMTELIGCSLVDAQRLIEDYIGSHGPIQTQTGEYWSMDGLPKVTEKDVTALFEMAANGEIIGRDGKTLHQLRILDLLVRMHWPEILVHLK